MIEPASVFFSLRRSRPASTSHFLTGWRGVIKAGGNDVNYGREATYRSSEDCRHCHAVAITTGQRHG